MEPTSRASFGQRLVALVVDTVVGNVLSLFVPGGSFRLTILLGIAYYVLLEGSPSGQTVGKRALRIRVVRADDGAPIGYPAALVRWGMRIVSGIAFGIGYLWMLWDPKKQTWHDKIAGTAVVRAADHPTRGWPGWGAPR